MSTEPLKSRYSLNEYLALEEAATDKHEFYRGELFLMAGASPRHNSIAGNIFASLHGQLRGKPCRPYNSDQRIAIRKYPLHTYPDVSVVCGQMLMDALDKQAATNPHTLVEVLSPTTENYDRGKKFDFYEALPSFQTYLLVSQDEPLVERFVRQPNDEWLLTKFHGLEAEVNLPGIDCRLRMADIYEGIDFAAELGGEAAR